MVRYKLEFSYQAELYYDIFINEDCSPTREDYLMERIKSIINDSKWEIECDSIDGEWIGVVIGCIKCNWNVEEYELTTNETDGYEVNLAGTIQFTTPTRLHYDSDISDRLIKAMDIHFEHVGYDFDDSIVYDKCRYLETSFLFEAMIDDSTVKASAILKELN